MAHPGVRAVPQTYRNTRFRSTLEADWAATLDSLAITWEYEPEAVQLPSGEFYRPDFYLPGCETWLEVKGPHDDRIGKVHELGAAGSHYPQCDGAARPDELRLSAWSDQEWTAFGRVLGAAPDGPTPVTVRRVEWLSDTTQPHYRVIQTARLKRGVTLDAATCAGLHEISRTANTGSCCDGGDGWGAPWRLVVVGRPARGGSAVWESAQGRNVWIIQCESCGQRSFFDYSGGWICRSCRAGGKVYNGGAWESGDQYGDCIRFVQAPRAPRRAR
jgi:hypothetical protein